MLFEEAKRFVQERHDEYQDYLAEGIDESQAMEMTLDGIGDNNDLFKLIWGSGAMDEALHASWETIEQAVREG